MKRTLLLLLLIAGLAIAAFFISKKSSDSTISGPLNNFAIEDTASVGAIFIADNKGNTAVLERNEENTWLINKKYPAREDAIETLLKTFKHIYIQRTVPKEAQSEVNRVMAASNKKVEIYDREGEWLKTYYVGYATMDKAGTYMLLETPEGKSSEPYIMDMKGFIGSLDTRFFTDEYEWRSPLIFKYDDIEKIQEVKVTYPSTPSESFTIKYAGGNDLSLFNADTDERVAPFDTVRVQNYMLNFKLAGFSSFKTYLDPQREDSVMMSPPAQIIEINHNGKVETIKLWVKEAPEGQTEGDGVTPAVIDMEKVFATYNDGQLAVAQRFVWDKFEVGLSTLKGIEQEK